VTILTARREMVLRRRIRRLVATTIGYNLVEAGVALAAGTAASSVALIGFGLDSLIEVSSAVAVAWQFTTRDPHRHEKATLRAIAVSFFALAAYLSVDAGRALATTDRAHPSAPGLVLAGCSLVVMPVLSGAQRRAGRELGSRTAVADSKQTLLCTYLSAVLLAGLAADALLGWWWADPVAALAIAAVAGKEGRDAWRGDACCPPAVLSTADGCGCGEACGCTEPAG
jgi:divalent metal cation (Fe/Co/Zn/Cd) transporter